MIILLTGMIWRDTNQGSPKVDKGRFPAAPQLVKVDTSYETFSNLFLNLIFQIMFPNHPKRVKRTKKNWKQFQNLHSVQLQLGVRLIIHFQQLLDKYLYNLHQIQTKRG